MSEETPPTPREEHQLYIPPPPSERSLTLMRFVFAMLALASACGLWLITDRLEIAWRIAMSVLVAVPFLMLPDLLRDKSKAPPGFKPRKWEDDEDDK